LSGGDQRRGSPGRGRGGSRSPAREFRRSGSPQAPSIRVPHRSGS
jgi:hypothetical protein